MCNQCHDSKREHGAAVPGRREVLMAGAALVTAPLLAGVATGAPTAQTGVPVGNGPFSARAYGATSATSPLGPLQIQRRAIGGVGAMVNSCGICENCLADLEQYCLNGNTLTYDSPDRVHGGYPLGGYSEKIVVSERFVIRIPPGVDLPATAPLLCAAITTFSSMRHWKLEAGQHVGVIGLGVWATWR
jgi:alcohol dehydrogenase (NADP+)